MSKIDHMYSNAQCNETNTCEYWNRVRRSQACEGISRAAKLATWRGVHCRWRSGRRTSRDRSRYGDRRRGVVSCRHFTSKSNFPSDWFHLISFQSPLEHVDQWEILVTILRLRAFQYMIIFTAKHETCQLETFLLMPQGYGKCVSRSRVSPGVVATGFSSWSW